jgi:hypothetical protein
MKKAVVGAPTYSKAIYSPIEMDRKLYEISKLSKKDAIKQMEEIIQKNDKIVCESIKQYWIEYFKGS